MVDLYRFNGFRQGVGVGVDMYSASLESEGWELLSNHENCSAAYAHRHRFVGDSAASPRSGSVASRSPLHPAHGGYPAYGAYSPRRKSEPWMRRSPSDRQLDQLASSDGQRRGRSQSPRPHSRRADWSLADRRQRRHQLQRPATPNHAAEGDEQQHPQLRQHGAAQEAAAAPTFRKSANVRELNLLQSFGQAVICTDLQGIITFWNRAAETLYGWRGEEVVGVSVLNVLIPSRLIKEAADIISRVGQGDSWTGRYPCLRRDGVVLDTVVTKSPIVDDNGTIVGVIGSSIDAKSINTDKSSLSRAYSNEWPKADLDGRCCDEDDQGRWSPWAADAHPRVPTDASQATDDSNKGSSKSLLQRLGCTSVQQILRKFNFRGYRSSGDSYAQSQQPKGKEQRMYSSESGSSQSRFSYRDDCSLDMREHMLSDSGQRSWTHAASESCSHHHEHVATASPVSTPSLGLPLGDVNVLSRTSSGSTGGSPMAASVAGSPNGSVANSGALSAVASGGVNFQQAEEDFQLQLALALRVAAEAAAIDDPDLVANLRGPIGSTRMMPGVSKIESIAYRYWVSNCLSYDDHVEDGFFEIWGMSPYVWSMCTDSNELGRMPPLESLRSVHPADAVFEVVLVDRSLDPELCELEDKAVSLAYDCTEVLDLARKLGKMVASVMGGAVASDEVLLPAWKSCSAQVMQVVSSIVLPIGKLKTGLCRHRALLFKVLADSVGLSCRLVRGSSYCGKEDDAMVVVKCGDDKEWMIDLLANAGQIMPPDARLSAPPAVISSPLQFDRASPFAGSSISVMDWARPELGSSAVSSPRAAGEQVKVSVPAVSNIAFITTVIEPNGTVSELPVENEGKWQIPFARGVPEEEQVGPVGNVGDDHDEGFCKNVVEDMPIVGQGAAEGVNGAGTPEGHNGQELEVSPVEAGRPDDGSPRVDTGRWAIEDMRHYIESGGASNTLKSSVVKRMLVNAEDFEIPWEDMSIGERIGQGSYGKVYRGDWQGSDVAVKVFLDQDLKLEALEEFRSEVAIMRRLRHPNIVLFMGAVMKPPNLSIVTEFCPRGSLFRLLHRPNRELDERRRIRMALDVVKGMNYLHRCSPPVVHRDLKSPNLLVDKNWTVKVCDFGLSRQKSSTFLSSKSSAGTPEWMAPEVLRNEPSDEKSDIYSFGVILWELATLQVPWAGLSPIQVVGAVGFQHRRLPIPDSVDPSIAAIIQACWRMDPKARPSFADIMQELKPLQRTQQNSPTQKRPTSPDATGLERA